MIKIFSFCSLLLIGKTALAQPKNLEVWFISKPRIHALYKILNEMEQIPHFKFTAVADYECTPMGEGCFHPQLGFIEKKGSVTAPEDKEYKTKKKYLSVEEVNKINCDKNYYFDMFCGKSKKVVNNNKVALEIWVDTSSSLREYDYAKKDENCGRKSFILAMQKTCNANKLGVSVFDTGRKQISDLDGLCMNYGLNDQERLIQWIRDSEAKTLIVITDISEYTANFSDFVDSIGGVVKGGDPVQLISATSLKTMASSLKKYCK